MVDAADAANIYSKRKAITAFFLYAVRQERDGECRMIGVLFRVASASGFDVMWKEIGPFIPALFDEAGPWTIVFVSPYVPWNSVLLGGDVVVKWVAAASEVLQVPYTEEVGQSVVGALLQIASHDSLRPRIPVGSWSWLNNRPSLPPLCLGRRMGSVAGVIREVQALGDIEVLKSY